MPVSRSHRGRRVGVAVAIVLLVVVASAAVVIAATSSPGPVARVALVIDGVQLAEFPAIEEVVSKVEVGDSLDPQPIKIVLRGPITATMEFDAWHDLVRNGDMAAALKNFSLIFYSPDGQPVLRYHVGNGFPTELVLSGEPAKGGELIYQTVTLTAESMQRVSP